MDSLILPFGSILKNFKRSSLGSGASDYEPRTIVGPPSSYAKKGGIRGYVIWTLYMRQDDSKT